MASMRSSSRTRQPKDPPWRCGHCKRLVKGKEEYCPGCHYHWTEIQDTSYAPNNWATEQQTPWKNQSRTSRSARARGQSQSRQRPILGLDARTMAGNAETGCRSTAQRQRKGQGASLASTCLTICACHLFWGSLDIIYGSCVTTTSRFGWSPQEGPGQVIPGGCHAPAAGADPGFKEHHTTVACGGLPAWTNTQKPTGLGESQAYYVPILGHLRFGLFGPLDVLCRGFQGQGHRAQQADRRSEESSLQEQGELRQYAEIEWSCQCRHFDM